MTILSFRRKKNAHVENHYSHLIIWEDKTLHSHSDDNSLLHTWPALSVCDVYEPDGQVIHSCNRKKRVYSCWTVWTLLWFFQVSILCRDITEATGLKPITTALRFILNQHSGLHSQFSITYNIYTGLFLVSVTFTFHQVWYQQWHCQ